MPPLLPSAVLSPDAEAGSRGGGGGDRCFSRRGPRDRLRQVAPRQAPGLSPGSLSRWPGLGEQPKDCKVSPVSAFPVSTALLSLSSPPVNRGSHASLTGRPHERRLRSSQLKARHLPGLRVTAVSRGEQDGRKGRASAGGGKGGPRSPPGEATGRLAGEGGRGDARCPLRASAAHSGRWDAAGPPPTSGWLWDLGTSGQPWRMEGLLSGVHAEVSGSLRPPEVPTKHRMSTGTGLPPGTGPQLPNALRGVWETPQVYAWLGKGPAKAQVQKTVSSFPFSASLLDLGLLWASASSTVRYGVGSGVGAEMIAPLGNAIARCHGRLWASQGPLSPAMRPRQATEPCTLYFLIIP